MKKMSKNMLLIVVGVLVAFSIDVAAEAVISSGAVSYSNTATSKTTVSGALDELFSAVDINDKIGNMANISSIGDGTITGAISLLNNNLSVVKRNSVTLSAWSTMGFVRGDSTWVTVYIPGIYIGVPGSMLKSNSNDIVICMYNADRGWFDITLTTPSIYQEEAGIRIISATSGIGIGGVATFSSDVILTA